MCTTELGHDRPSTEIEIRLVADELAPGKARRFVRHHIERLGHPRCVDDAAVVVSELVTNANAAAPWGPIFVALPRSGICRPNVRCCGSPKSWTPMAAGCAW